MLSAFFAKFLNHSTTKSLLALCLGMAFSLPHFILLATFCKNYVRKSLMKLNINIDNANEIRHCEQEYNVSHHKGAIAWVVHHNNNIIINFITVYSKIITTVLEKKYTNSKKYILKYYKI